MILSIGFIWRNICGRTWLSEVLKNCILCFLWHFSFSKKVFVVNTTQIFCWQIRADKPRKQKIFIQKMSRKNSSNRGHNCKPNPGQISSWVLNSYFLSKVENISREMAILESKSWWAVGPHICRCCQNVAQDSFGDLTNFLVKFFR